jgi:hypothetical protein
MEPLINQLEQLPLIRTPNNLFGNTRNKLNVGKKYHSGKISKGAILN